MTINDIELNFKLTNAAVADRYESALLTMRKKGEELEKHPPVRLADAIREQTALVKEFIDRVFGEGTYAALKVDPDDLDENLEIAAQVIEESGRQYTTMKRRIGRYDPKRITRHA